MFWFRRRSCPVPFRFLLLLFGVKWAARQRLSDADREVYRDKARRFRSKFREAIAVWDEESPVNEPSGRASADDEGSADNSYAKD